MKVIGVCASPRISGNTNILIDEVLGGAIERGFKTSKFFLDELDIDFCHACGTCGDGIDCINDDDCQKIHEEILKSDVLVFGTPIYYGQISAQAKLFIDRFYSISKNPQKSFKGKKAVFIVCYGASQGYYAEYINKTKKIFQALEFDLVDVIEVGALKEAGQVRENEEIMKKSFELASLF